MLTTLATLFIFPEPALGPPLARALELVASLTFTWALVAIGRHDAATLRIPDRILGPAAAAIGTCLVAASMVAGSWQPFNAAALGAVQTAGLYLALHLLSRGSIGFGDVKFAALIGLVIGWNSAAEVWVATVVAFVGAGLGVIVLLATRNATRHTHVPLAPWMALGAFAVLVTS